MLSIFITFAACLVSFFLIHKGISKKFFQIIFFVFFNIFFLELIVYGYFLYLINQNQGFLLIGHQFFLDQLIKLRLVNKLYVNPNDHNQFYRLDPDLGYTIARNKKYFLYQSTRQGLRGEHTSSLFPTSDVLR